MRYAGSCGPTRWAGGSAAWAPGRAASPSASTSGSPIPARRAPTPEVTTTALTRASARMSATRRSGWDGSTGTYAAPERRMPSTEATMAVDGSATTPTREPRPTPRAASRAAIRPAHASRAR